MKQTKFGKIKILICMVLALCMVFALTACRDDEVGTGGGTFKINLTNGTVDVGSNSLTLMATGNGSTPVEWSSSNESVATVTPVSVSVSTAVRITGISVGTATITATAGEKTATCVVTVTNPEVISVTQNASSVSSLQLSQNETAQLAASSSKNHNIVWTSSNDLIATVSQTGLVTAVASSGTAYITAKCGGSDNTTGAISSTVTVKIGSGVDSSYTIGFATEAEANSAPGLWKYWNEFNNVLTAEYREGKASISFENNGANWYNVQMFYTASASDTDTSGAALKAGTLYKVDFDAESDVAGKVTVNGNIISLNQGKGRYTAYYIHGATAFTLVFGYQNETQSGGWDLVTAAVSVSNISWTEVTPIRLTEPTFGITNNKIEILDSNPEGSVGRYVLVVYDGDTVKGEVTVADKDTIDASAIRPSGTYTAKLKAIAANPRYIDSVEAMSALNTVNVVASAYTLPYVTGTAAAGTWAYWASSWVEVTTKTCSTDNVVTMTFSNNAGNWYDTQIKYKSLHAVGDTYKITVTITVDAENIGDGKVSVSAGGYDANNSHYNQVHNLHVGENTIEIDVEEGATNSLQITFGVAEENNAQCIKSGTVTVKVVEG